MTSMPCRSLLVPLLFLGGCASDPPPTSAPAEVVVEAPPAPSLEPFTQQLARTDLTFDMVPVPAGAVEIDGVMHEIPAFWAAETESTWDLYDIFVYETDKGTDGEPEPEADAISRPSRPYVAPDRGYGHQGYAAISLSFQGAESYAKWLSAKTGRTYRLPTEIEWRYLCARSGITPEVADDFAWHEDNAEWEPHAVASKNVDAGGLYDLWGNVREWAVGIDGAPVALGGAFWDPPDEIGCAGRHVPDSEWQMTDPQVPKSPWWLSDAPFMGCRMICIPSE